MVSDIGCECCKPEFRFKLIPAEQIMSAQVTDDTTFSLKVYAEAYLFAMQELTGGVDREFSIRVLNECRIDIAKGHWMEFAINLVSDCWSLSIRSLRTVFLTIGAPYTVSTHSNYCH